MRIDDFSITELSRLLNRSRPTVYKYITDYKSMQFNNIPYSVKELFDRIENGCAKSDAYAYCEANFSESGARSEELRQLINLIIENEKLLNLEKLKSFVKGEIQNGKRAND